MVSPAQRPVEEGQMTMESKQEEPPLYIDINGHYVQNVMKFISHDYKPKGKVLKQYSPKLNRIPENMVYRPRQLQTSVGPRNTGKPSDRSHTMTSAVNQGSRSADRSTSTSYPKKSSSSLEDASNGEGSFSFSCVVCNLSFTNRIALLTHQRSHFTEGSLFCSECGRSFTRNCDLLAHHRVHTGERPFICSECGVCYSNKRYLNKHMKVHTGEGAHQCPECGKCFSQKGLLLSHLKVHTG
ncbi:histone-lysine N-methyltransferase PRDM9-like [Rana temporaria]|uniref:histone-lysine N-methyltransferase PRDM9-like n=1 Tax=Rana temporaria TaxID=8407 RepID=UPI001AACDEB7|nr:histone-lysine N-methyltransferase PRDM9-like [Rana temporaria]